MIKEGILLKILSYIHLVFFASLLWMATVVLSGTLLFLPGLAAIFAMGKGVLYKEFDINNSVIKDYLRYLKSSLGLLKFLAIQIMIILNMLGIYIATKLDHMLYSVICLVIVAFLIAFQFYMAGFWVFVREDLTCTEVVISMFLKPLLLFPIFVAIVLLLLFISKELFFVILFTGAFFLFAFEVIVFIQMLYYKAFTNTLEEEDEFAHLVYKKAK